MANINGRLGVSLPILNNGSSTAVQLTITDLAVGNTHYVAPALPIILGDVSPNNYVLFNGDVASTSLSEGARHLLVVRGTYRVEGLARGFALNRYINVPSVTASPLVVLNARAQSTVDLQSGLWSYSLVNSGSSDSEFSIDGFSLDLGSPTEVAGTPNGWSVETDGLSYAFWVTRDQTARILPGYALSGFVLRSASRSSAGKGYFLTSWSNVSNGSGILALGSVLTPSAS